MENTLTTSQILEPIHTSLHVRVVDDQDVIEGSTQLSVVFDETWYSSMMFSSMLTIVQSSGHSDDSLVLRPPALSFAAWPCACCTLTHPLLGLVHVLLTLTRIVSPCFTRPIFQLRLSSRAPPDSTKRAPSTRSIWSWFAFITMYSTLQMLRRGHFSSYERCGSRNTLFSCLQLGSFALRQERVL